MKTLIIFFLSGTMILSFGSLKEKGTPILSKILWSQTDTSHNNYRIPSIIVSKNNTLLAFAEGREGGDSGDIDILLKRSTDNGKTWKKQLVVWDDSTNTCGNPCPVVDPVSGRIVLLMTWNLGTDHEKDIIRKKSKGTRIPFVCWSDDDGLTWSKPRNLMKSAKKEDWGWFATGPGVGISLQSEKYKNRLLIPCNNSYDNPENTRMDGYGFGCHVLISDNGGADWRMSEIITPEVNESQITELSDGRLLMNMRSYHGKNSRAVSYSDDGGETWSAVVHDPQLTEPVCQGSILRFGEYKDQNMYLFSNPTATFERSHMTVKTSFDDCMSWSNSKLIYPGPSAYSCLTKLPNGNIGLLFEAGSENPYENIVFLSFSPKELFTPGTLLPTL